MVLINAVEKFEQRKANNGDTGAVFRLLKLYTERKDWHKCGEYALKIVDRSPGYCERKLLEYIGEEIRYEDMLGIISIYYDETGDYEMSRRWVQKFSDYIDYAYRDLPWLDREQKKTKFELYNSMLECGELDNIEHRFMLKWEEKIYLRIAQPGFPARPKPQPHPSQTVSKGNSFLTAITRFISRMKKTLAP